jgi:hypothetical protein
MNSYTNTWGDICQKYDYVCTTGKDLLINIPTRNNAVGLAATLTMMYKTCSSTMNFDIHIIVDDDQIDLYKDVKEKITPGLIRDKDAREKENKNNIIWSYPKHQKDDWWNIFTARHNLLKLNDYYFEGLWTDDFEGLSPNWDKRIISKKHYFEDDIFSLHTNRDGIYGRSIDVFKSCYVDNGTFHKTGGIVPPSHLIWNYSECLPITTRKLSLLLYEIMKPYYMTAMTEMLVASVIMLLYKEHGHKRLVDGGYSFSHIKDSGGSTMIGCGGFNSKKDFFDHWTTNENYKIIRPIVKKMNKLISSEEHLRDFDEIFGNSIR